MTTEAERLAVLLDAEQVRTVHLDVMHHDAAKLLREQAAEIERLTNCLRLEQNRMERIGTHANDCYKWGPAHWECAMREIERKDALLRQALEMLDKRTAEAIKQHLEQT